MPLLFIMALVLTLFLASGTVTAERLFQSPPSPPAQPPSEQPVPEQPLPEQPLPEQPQPEQPLPEQPQPEQPLPEQMQPDQPASEQLQPEQPAPEQSSPEQPAIEQSPAQPSDEAAPAPTLEPLGPLGPAEEFDDSIPPLQDSPLVLDRAELIDSIVVSGAYIWLCCGVLLLLLIPLFLLILYIRGRSKIVNEDGF